MWQGLAKDVAKKLKKIGCTELKDLEALFNKSPECRKLCAYDNLKCHWAGILDALRLVSQEPLIEDVDLLLGYHYLNRGNVDKAIAYNYFPAIHQRCNDIMGGSTGFSFNELMNLCNKACQFHVAAGYFLTSKVFSYLLAILVGRQSFFANDTLYHSITKRFSICMYFFMCTENKVEQHQ